MERNPELASVDPVRGPVNAPGGSDAITYFATRWFENRAGSAWLTSPIADPPSQPRAVYDQLATADLPFEQWIMDMYSSRASLKKLVADAEAQPAHQVAFDWVLTDLASAEQLGMPIARLQNSRGEWVAPTTESLNAAVAGMEQRSDGTVIAGTGGDAAGAYPLTFVEHAVVPAEPDCAPEPGSPVAVLPGAAPT